MKPPGSDDNNRRASNHTWPFLAGAESAVPQERVIWEDVLPREIGRSALEYAVLQLQLPVTAPQLGEFFLIGSGHPVAAAILIGVGLVHPVPQARIADAEVFGDFGHRCGALAGELDGALTELQRVWCRHQDILPGDRRSPQVGCPCYAGKLRADPDHTDLLSVPPAGPLERFVIISPRRGAVRIRALEELREPDERTLQVGHPLPGGAWA